MLEARDEYLSYRPCAVLTLADGQQAAKMERALRLLGWDVYTARSGPETRRLARMLEAELILLDADLPGESGWLTCEKLRRESPMRIYIVANVAGARQQELGDFVGATAVLDRHCDPGGLGQCLEAISVAG